jgi:hypothetical protein
LINLNNKITFIEGDVLYINNNIDFISQKEQFNLDEKINFIDDKTNILNINIFIGNFSSYLNNQLLNSDYYKNDRKFKELKYEPYFDEKSNNNRNINIFHNPLVFNKTLGIDSTFYFDDLYITPFNDVENIENDISIYFKDKNLINYPYYYNSLNSIDKNAEICITGIVEELNDEFTAERLLSKGLKAEIISNGLDARSRNISINNKYDISEKLIEPFSDEEIDNIITGNDILLQRKINYTNVEINGIIYNVANYTNETNSFMPSLTNKILYYSEDNNFIIPFDDNLSDDIINDTNIVLTTGSDYDKSKSSNYDSFAYTKELD